MNEPVLWKGPLPRHLAIIMDGNGRWARGRGLPRIEGHRTGADAVRAVVRCCRRIGIEALTLYAFSAQNWQRPDGEVGALMELLFDYLKSERAEIMDNGIRFNCVGDLARLPHFVRRPAELLMDASKDHQGMVLTLALSYGGREEILHAARAVAAEVASGELQLDQLDAEALEAAMWTRGLPPRVDLVIRTGGDQRVSNFLLWQIAYAELYFTEALWPDFDEGSLVEALGEFGRRERRFGGLGAAETELEAVPC